MLALTLILKETPCFTSDKKWCVSTIDFIPSLLSMFFCLPKKGGVYTVHDKIICTHVVIRTHELAVQLESLQIDEEKPL
jgi:hypothetical protein